MVVIFGHSPRYGHLHTVQEFVFGMCSLYRQKSVNMMPIQNLISNFLFPCFFLFYFQGEREWNVVKTRGYPVRGGYGHTSTLDPLTQLIFVYGGFIYDSSLILSSRLYSYEPNSRVWYVQLPLI